jgi:hypothetical protein
MDSAQAAQTLDFQSRWSFGYTQLQRQEGFEHPFINTGAARVACMERGHAHSDVDTCLIGADNACHARDEQRG